MLRLLVKLYESVESPDWVSICQCLMFLDDAAEVAKILERLIKGSEVRVRAPGRFFLLTVTPQRSLAGLGTPQVSKIGI